MDCKAESNDAERTAPRTIGTRPALGAVLLVLLGSAAAFAAVVPAPSSLEIAPGATSAVISAALSFPAAISEPDPFPLDVTFPPGLAPHASTLPASVEFLVPLGGTSAIATFRIALGTGAPPGIYSVVVAHPSDLDPDGSSSTLTLRVPVSSAAVAPPSLRLTQGATSESLLLRVENAAGSFSFRPRLPAALEGNTTLTPVPVDVTVPVGASSASAPFRLGTTLATPPGVHAIVLSDAGRGLTATLRLEVSPSPAQVSLEPPRVSLVAGETSDPVTLTVANVTDARFAFEAQLPPPVVGLLSIQPLRVRVEVAPGSTSGQATFVVRTAPAVPSGTYRIPLTDARTGAMTELVVRVRPPRGSLVVEPDPVTVSAGGGASAATVRVEDTNAGGRTLFLLPEPPPILAGQLVFDPPSIALLVPPGASAAAAGFRVAARSGAPPGIYRVTLAEPTLGFETAFTLEIRPGVRITSIAPTAVTAGALDTALVLLGVNFALGGRLESDSPVLRFGPALVASPFEARTTIGVRADAAPGRTTVRWVNPDGASATAELVVLGRNSLAGPLAITTAAIVHPLPGALLGVEDRVYPRGLLAVVGTGNVVGVWRLDGIVFDRFTASAVAGEPVTIESRVPIPALGLGNHRLELALESPQVAAAAAVVLTVVGERASALRLLAPEPGLVTSRAADLAPAFRWSAVPGAEGYAVEFLRQEPLPPLRFLARGPFWRPSQWQLDRLDPGVHEWRVRPVFPAMVDGQPSESRRLVVLPDRVDLKILRPVVAGEASWTGGSPGLIYRVEVLEGGSGRAAFSALTPGSSYRFPAARRGALPPHRVRVTALAPGGREVGRSEVVAVPAGPVVAVPAAAGAAVEIVAFAPPEAGVVVETHPRISARWGSPVGPDRVTLVVDDLDVTAFARIEPTAITYESLLPLAAGPHRVHLVVGDTLSSWSFRVEPGEPAARAPETPPAAGEEGGEWREESGRVKAWGDWAMTLEGDVTLLASDDLPDDELTSRQSLSLQADLQREKAFVRLNGDLSESQVLDGEDRQSVDQRNWVATIGARGDTVTGEVTAGFAPPDFLAGSTLLTAGLTRGGAQAKLEGGRARLSLYRTYDDSFAGVTSGSFGPEQEIQAAALELFDGSGRVTVRAIGMEVDEPGGAFGAGGNGTVAGLTIRFAPKPTLEIQLEAAQGEFTPALGSFESERRGNAYRLSFDRRTSGLLLALDLRHTDEDYVNPANRGLTPGGVSDRTGGELSLTRFWGVSSFSVRYRLLEGGTSSGLQSGAVTQNGADAAFSTRLGQRVSLSISGRRTETESGGDPALALPAGTQTDWGTDLQLSESFGTFTFTQSLGFQKSEDDVDPNRLSEVSNFNLSLSGAPSERFRLFAQAGATRTEQAPAYGTTDTLLASFQPSLSLAGAGLLVQPYLSYNRSENDVTSRRSETELYQLSFTWTPPKLRSRVALQGANGWSRSRLAGEPSRGFDQRTTLSVIVRWNGPSSPATGADQPLSPPVASQSPLLQGLGYPAGSSTGWPAAVSPTGSI